MAKVRSERPKAREEDAGILCYFEDDDRRFGARSSALAITKKGEQIVTVYEQLIEEGRKKGLREGIAKGVAKGVAQGRAAMLIDQLAAKFGPVSRAYKTRVEHATDAELLLWGRRVLTATSVEDTFEENDKASEKSPVRARRSAKKRV
ncbi:MAG: hypothetical protein IPK82_17225 [Polyangiaceae bacterium]|nr:hypothetical protein [Polyangiaceae bacterium]